MVGKVNRMRHQLPIYSTEQELWSAFRAGEQQAFSLLFHTYVDAMYAYGRKMATDGELVKDTIQDVFVKLYHNRENLRETVSVKGYLFVALKRALINAFSSRPMVRLDDSEEIVFEIELLSEKAFDEVEECYDDEVKQELAKALKELSPRQREAIYLYYIQEIPLTDIPDLLGMSYQSTRNLLYRAMTKLRQQLQAVSTSASMSLLLLQYLSK